MIFLLRIKAYSQLRWWCERTNSQHVWKRQSFFCQGHNVLTAVLFPLISDNGLWLTLSQDESRLLSETLHSESQDFFFFLYFKKDSWPYRAFHLQFDFLKLYGRRRNNISHVRVSSNWLLENELWRFNSAWIGNMLWRMWLISCTSHSENDFSSQLFFLPCVLDNLQVFFGFNFFSL